MATGEKFRGRPGQPGMDYFAITPSDTVGDSFPEMTKWIHCGGDGNIAAVRRDGTAITFTACKAGVWYPISARRVNSTNTTATNLVGIY